MNKKIMAVGAHADDIEGNVGGTLLKYYERGYEIIYVMSTNNFSGCWSRVEDDGSVKVDKPVPEVIMPQRKLEAEKGAIFFGAKPIYLDHPQRHYFLSDGSQSEVRYGSSMAPFINADVPTILTAHENKQCVEEMAGLIEKYEPELILTHGPVQFDLEHSGTMLLVTKAYWNNVEKGFNGGLLYWNDGITYLGFSFCRWDTHIDISNYLERKTDACAVHASQLPFPYRNDFPITSRNRNWGSALNCRAAEVFNICNIKKQGLYPEITMEMIYNWK